VVANIALSVWEVRLGLALLRRDSVSDTITALLQREANPVIRVYGALPILDIGGGIGCGGRPKPDFHKRGRTLHRKEAALNDIEIVAIAIGT